MRNEVKAILEKLQRVAIKVEGYLANAVEGGDAEDRLSAELESLQGAIELIEEIE